MFGTKIKLQQAQSELNSNVCVRENNILEMVRSDSYQPNQITFSRQQKQP